MSQQREEVAAVNGRESRDALAQALEGARFEVVPVRGVIEHARHLPPGSTVTVTCSPTRGIENTLSVAEELARLQLRVVPHLSARLVVDETHLRAIVQRLRAGGFREAFVIGGDVPKPLGKYVGALDLLQGMAELGHELEEIGIAGYPEHHPLIDDATLRGALREKQAFATYMVTQICFSPRTIVDWLTAVRDEGVDLPAYIGLPGVVNTGRLLQISLKIGVGDSLRFLAKNTSLVAGLLGGGKYQPDQLVEGLVPCLEDIAYGIRGLHFNTFNQVETTELWRERTLLAVTRT